MTKELLERLHSYTCAADAHLEAFRLAADAIEAMQARCAELEDELGSSTTYTLNELQAKVCGLAGERDRLKSELAEIHKQEPVSHRYRFIHPISGEPVWRDSSSTWNGQCVQEVQQLFAAPIPPVQVPAGSIRLWDAQWVSIVNHDNAYNGWSTNDAVNHAVRMTERYIAANVAQNNLPPLPAVKP